MPKFQVLTAKINLAGDRDQSVYRGADSPITLPEVHVLRAIHGRDHVFDLVSLPDTDHALAHPRSHDDERDRLAQMYGKNAVESIFPPTMPLPESDEAIPTVDEVEAAEKAAEEARSKARAAKEASGKKKAKVDAETPSVVPSLDDLPVA